MKKDIIFCTVVSDNYWDKIGIHKFINSFNKFCLKYADLHIFRQQEINDFFATDSRLNFYNSKAGFAKQFLGKYKTIIWIDADSVFCDELDEIWAQDYDIAVTNNYWMGCNPNECVFHIDNIHYIHGALVASSSNVFWDTWDYANRNYARIKNRGTYYRYWDVNYDDYHYFRYWDNDILNIVYLLCRGGACFRFLF